MIHNTTGRAKNLGLTPRNGTFLLKITIFYFLLFSKNGRNFLPFVSYTFENFFKTCLSFLSFCSIIRVLPVPLFKIFKLSDRNFLKISKSFFVKLKMFHLMN